MCLLFNDFSEWNNWYWNWISTNVPCFNPIDIINNLLKLMMGKKVSKMTPWYRGFKGKIFKKDGKFVSKGIVSVEKNNVNITELPIGVWTDKYKEYIETLIVDKSCKNEKELKNQVLSGYRTDCTETDVDFTLKFKKSCDDLDKTLKLTSSKATSLSNIHLYNRDGTITKYNSPEHIIEEFYVIRLEYYEKRLNYLLEKFKSELDIIKSKVKFIEGFVNEEIKILNVEEEKIIKQLDKMDLVKVDDSYDYLINMRIRSLTKSKIIELKKQEEVKLAEYNKLLENTPKNLWKEDLKKLKKSLKN